MLQNYDCSFLKYHKKYFYGELILFSARLLNSLNPNLKMVSYRNTAASAGNKRLILLLENSNKHS